jgi:hypothetical protein
MVGFVNSSTADNDAACVMNDSTNGAETVVPHTGLVPGFALEQLNFQDVVTPTSSTSYTIQCQPKTSGLLIRIRRLTAISVDAIH